MSELPEPSELPEKAAHEAAVAEAKAAEQIYDAARQRAREASYALQRAVLRQAEAAARSRAGGSNG